MNFLSSRSSRLRRPRRGFTLIELLTVIAIIGVLAGIIIPVVGKVRTSAKRAQGLSNLRQIMLASISFMEDNKGNWFVSENEGGASNFYSYVLTRYIARQSGTNGTTASDIFSDPLLPKTGQLQFAALEAYFTGGLPGLARSRNLRSIKAPAQKVLFADNWNKTNTTDAYVANGTIQNTGIAVWSWPGVWGGVYTPSEADGKRLPPADFGNNYGHIDLMRDPGQAKLGFLDGHVAIVKREQMFHRLFDPRFE